MVVIDLGKKSAKATLKHGDHHDLIDYIAQVMINNFHDPGDFEEVMREFCPKSKKEVLQIIQDDIQYMRLAREYEAMRILGEA